MPTVAERIYQRSFHSEADRQALIDKKARSIAMNVVAGLLSSDSELYDVASDMFCGEPQGMMELIRCALRGDISGANVARQIVLTEVDRVVRQIAEIRAIREVEAMTPDDFEN